MLENKADSQDEKSVATFWNSVLKAIKEEKNQMLFATLQGTKATKIDDLTVGIEFTNGLDSFKKTVIERNENMQEIRRLVSIECKKDMRIKLIDKSKKTGKKQSTPLENLGININIIE